MHVNFALPCSQLRAMLFVIQKVSIFYIPLGLECYCYDEPNNGFPVCFFENDRCTGDICYARKVLDDNGVLYSTWNCLSESINQHIDHICNRGSFNTDTEQYICCSDRDNCNENIRIVLPIERTQPVPDVTSAPGSGSGDITPDLSIISTGGPESTTSTPVSTDLTSRQPSTPLATTAPPGKNLVSPSSNGVSVFLYPYATLQELLHSAAFNALMKGVHEHVHVYWNKN